jgi:hypothetical protein
VEQTVVPGNADRSSPANLSDQCTSTAQQRADTIERLPSVDNASVQTAKDDVTVVVHEDPLDLGKHRRENVTQKQMKVEHPLAKPKHMKV